MTSTRASGARRADPRWLAAIAALTLLAFALRAWGFRQGLLGDELFAYKEIHGQSLEGVFQQMRDNVEVSPPLYFVLAWLSAKAGDPTVWIRLPSLILGTVLVPLVFALGRRAAGSWAGLCAAALVAVSPFAIFYAGEARPYATMTFFAALSAYFLLRALERNRGRWWAMYAVTAVLVAYSHYTGVFVLGAQTLWALWFHRERLGAILATSIAAFLLVLPWLTTVDSKEQLAVYGPFDPGPKTLAAVVRVLFGHPFIPLRDTPGWPALALIAPACLVALVVLFRKRSRREDGHPRQPEILLFAALALATPAGVLLTSAISGYEFFSARNLNASLPAAAILIGYVLTAPPRRLAIALAAMVVAGTAIGGVLTLSESRQRSDGRAAAAFIDARAEPSDHLIYLAPAASTSNRPLDPYLQGGRRPVFGDPRQYRATFARAARAGATVFVAFPSLAAIVPLVAPPESLSQRFHLVADRRFPGFGGGLRVRVFEPAPGGR